MSNVDYTLGFAFLALGIVLAYFAVDGFRMWRADRRERQWQRELDEMLEREELLRKANQRMIDEAYRHSLPPDPEAIIRAERMTKAGALDQQGNVLYGWAIPAGTSRARVERAEERRKNEEARRHADAVEFAGTPPQQQMPLFTELDDGRSVRASYSPASEPAVRDVPFVSTGGGSFDGGGSSASWSPSSSSDSSSGGSSSYSSGDSGSSSGGSSSCGSD